MWSEWDLVLRLLPSHPACRLPECTSPISDSPMPAAHMQPWHEPHPSPQQLHARGLAVAESSFTSFFPVNVPIATHRVARLLTSRSGTWAIRLAVARHWLTGIKLDRSRPLHHQGTFPRYSCGELPVRSLSFFRWAFRSLGLCITFLSCPPTSSEVR